VTFFVAGIAQPKGSTRAFVPKGWTRAVITSANPKLKDWQCAIASEARPLFAIPAPREVPVKLVVQYLLRRPKSLSKWVECHTKKPDLDKLVRATKDALTGVAWVDDSQVIAVDAVKAYARDRIGVSITVRYGAGATQ
jgi:Holliday junction resolvase RusA-like endonuclease